jgi:hypothetical protein
MSDAVLEYEDFINLTYNTIQKSNQNKFTIKERLQILDKIEKCMNFHMEWGFTMSVFKKFEKKNKAITKIQSRFKGNKDRQMLEKSGLWYQDATSHWKKKNKKKVMASLLKEMITEDMTNAEKAEARELIRTFLLDKGFASLKKKTKKKKKQSKKKTKKTKKRKTRKRKRKRKTKKRKIKGGWLPVTSRQHIYNGEIFDVNISDVDEEGHTSWTVPKGKYDFIILNSDPDKLLLLESGGGTLGHSSFPAIDDAKYKVELEEYEKGGVRNNPTDQVKFAGEIALNEDGNIGFWNCKSGHFLPDPEDAKNAGLPMVLPNGDKLFYDHNTKDYGTVAWNWQKSIE